MYEGNYGMETHVLDTHTHPVYCTTCTTSNVQYTQVTVGFSSSTSTKFSNHVEVENSVS